MYVCEATQGSLCSLVMELNDSGYTVVKTKLIDKKVYEVYFRLREEVQL